VNEGAEEYLKEVQSPSGLKRVLTFEVPRDRVEREIADIIKGIGKDIKLPGFRPGKAPADIIRARFGKTAEKEAIEKLIPEAYQKALEKESLRPVTPAEISEMTFEAGEPLSFQIAIEIYPPVKLGEYKGIKVKREIKPVEDADVDREIQGLCERLSRFENLDRPSETGDVVIADYWRLGPDGKMVRGSRTANYPFELGAKGMFQEFNEGLAGVSPGDTKNITVKYADDFHQEEVRGKTVEFGLEIKRVGRRIVPDLDDEFAKSLGVESAEDVKTKMRETMKETNETEATNQAKREVVRQIVEKSDFEVPQGLVDRALESMMKSYKDEFDASKDTTAAEKLTEMEEKLRPLAVNLVKEEFIIADIAERESIVVEDSDIEAIIATIAARSGKPADEVRKQASESDEIDHWRRDVLKKKVLDFLYANAEVTG
jgi:trigger factor